MANGCSGYTPDSLETLKELVHGQVLTSNGSFSGILPVPVSEPGGTTSGDPNVTATLYLVAVLAAKTNAADHSDTVIQFDPSSVADLTYIVVDGRLEWKTPDEEEYLLVAIYGRGTGQILNMYDSKSSDTHWKGNKK